MLTKEQFINAMGFFKDYDRIQNALTGALSPFFDGNGFLYTGNNCLNQRYLNLLKLSMNIDLEEEYDPISLWLYEASNNIYSEPDENGICKKIGEADHNFIEIQINGKKYHIKDESDLYDYIKQIYS
ncbi:MAG: hypothetical protein IJ880_11255 [Bacilli bacterium]|nr:hypothetical protein [Bacilli bacterium]